MDLKSPRRCVLEMDYACNLFCRTCNIWKSDFKNRRSSAESMNREAIFSLQEKLKAAGIQQITYVGGEPLLFAGLVDVIRQGQLLGLKVAVVTNGTMLSSHMGTRLFEAGLHTLIVSIDGPARIHDTLRGKPGTFSLVYKNLQHLTRLKKKEGRKYPKINIYSTLSRLNRSAIPSLLSIAQRLDINSIRFQLVSVITPEIQHQIKQLFSADMVGYHSYAVDPDLRPSPAEMEGIRRSLVQASTWAGRTGIRVQSEAILSENCPTEGCTFIDNSMVINPAGEILPCPMLTGLSIGNLTQIPFSQIWDNPIHQKFLHTFRQKNRLPICLECCVEKLAPHQPDAKPNRSA